MNDHLLVTLLFAGCMLALWLGFHLFFVVFEKLEKRKLLKSNDTDKHTEP